MKHRYDYDYEYDDRFDDDDDEVIDVEPNAEPWSPDDLTQGDRDRAADDAAERNQQ